MAQSTPEKKIERHYRKLKRSAAQIQPAPGQAAQRMSLFDALSLADRQHKSGNASAALHICAQLENDPAAAVDARMIRLQIFVDATDTRAVRAEIDALGGQAPRDPFGITVLANAHRQCGNHERAIDVLSRGVRDYPANAHLRELRGIIHADAANTEAAVGDLRRALRIDPKLYGAYKFLSNYDSLSDSELAELEALTPPDHYVADVAAAIAVTYRSRGDAEREMHHLTIANDKQNTQWSWRPAADTAKTNAVIAQCGDAFFSSVAATARDERQPIFIVGMPRSGSTLIEQMLAQHPEIETAGETHLVLALVNELAERHRAEYPQFLRSLTDDDYRQFADRYLESIDATFSRSAVFVDKQLENHYFLGLLARALPGARFIHTERDPIDTCLSCYQQVFTTVPYANSFENLAAKYHNKTRLMAHWKAQLPDRVHAVRYERVVADAEREARALLSFCGLDWDDGVLEFSASRRSVRTASVQQVRQGIYSTSVEKWRRYEPFLTELRVALKENARTSG